jgi:site-specific DNA recombinase
MKVAVYARVSSDDQAERDTIQNQLGYLRERCRLDQIDICETYTDEGVSGVVPLQARPAGRQLLADARGGNSRRCWCSRWIDWPDRSESC